MMNKVEKMNMGYCSAITYKYKIGLFKPCWIQKLGRGGGGSVIQMMIVKTWVISNFALIMGVSQNNPP